MIRRLRKFLDDRTANVAVSLKLAARAYVLENGRVTPEGTGAELLADERVKVAYLRM